MLFHQIIWRFLRKCQCFSFNKLYWNFFSAVFIALKFWVVVPYLTSYRGTTIPSDVCNIVYLHNTYPSSIYSWSISHILEHEFFYLGCLGSSGSKEKKWIWVFLSNFWGWFFQLFVSKIFFKNFLKYFSIRMEKSCIIQS